MSTNSIRDKVFLHWLLQKFFLYNLRVLLIFFYSESRIYVFNWRMNSKTRLRSFSELLYVRINRIRILALNCVSRTTTILVLTFKLSIPFQRSVCFSLQSHRWRFLHSLFRDICRNFFLHEEEKNWRNTFFSSFLVQWKLNFLYITRTYSYIRRRH